MKIFLLFGANGFVGHNLFDYYHEKKDILLIAPKRAECDVLKLSEVKAFIKKHQPDVVINAAYIGVDSTVKVTKKYLSDNTKIPLNILKACKGIISVKRIIFYGSGLEYGDSKIPILETHSLHPKNYYAETKAITSKASIALAKELKLPLVLIRAFNIYGPYDSKGVIDYMIKSTLAKKTLALTKGDQLRDFIYIGDLVNITDKIINYNGTFAHGEIFNAGFGKGVLLKDIVSEICKQTQYTLPIAVKEYRPNEYFSQTADIQKAKKLLDWQPETGIEEGIKKTITAVRLAIAS